MEFRYKVRFGETGFPWVEREPSAYLRVDHGGEENGPMQVSVVGNREGLLHLAKQLIALAGFEGPEGYHIHLDPSSEPDSPRGPLDPESDALILYRRERPR